LLDELRSKQKIYSDQLVNPEITGPEFDGPEIRVGDQQLPLTLAREESLEPASQSQRPRRSAGLPQRFDGCEIDLPGRPVGSIRPPDKEILSGISLAAPSEDLQDDNLRAIWASLTCAIYKIEKYVALLEDSPAYWAAMILHPGYKKRWIERNLSAEHASRVFAAFTDLFERDYNKVDARPIQQPERATPTTLAGDDFYDQPEDPAQKDELPAYFSGPLLPVKDPLEWWRKKKEDFPRLSRMAFNLLTIPPTACECERCFSRTKLTVGTQRHSLHERSMEMLACLKIWGRVRGF
jgi:hypothetical protein